MKRFLFGMVLVVSTLSLFGCGSKARTIKVEECAGTSMISNAKGNQDAFVGQHLESGDYVNVSEDATLLLLLDSDKHVFANSGAKFHVVAYYENKAAKTLVEQADGMLLYGIDNPLKVEDTFMVTTQNVLLAVRGTVYTVDVTAKETTLDVKEGTVYTETIENGKPVTRFVTAGEKVSFAGTAPAFHEVTFAGELPSVVPAGNTSGGAANGGTIQAVATMDRNFDLGSQTIDASFMGVYKDDSMTIVVAPGVAPYQLSQDGLLPITLPETDFWIVSSTPSTGESFAANLSAPSSNLATDFTTRDGVTHYVDLSYSFDGNTLTYHREFEDSDGPYKETKVLTKTDEDPVEAYYNLVSKYTILEE